VTSRETLALAAVALPALTALVVAVAPRRAIQPAAIAGLVLSGAVSISLALVALVHPADLEVTGWVVVDAAAGLMVGVIGLVGLASALVSPSYLQTATAGLFGARHGARGYYAALGNEKEGIKFLSQAAALAPDVPEVLYQVAVGYELLRHRDEALRWLAKSRAGGYPAAAIARNPQLTALRADPHYGSTAPTR